MLKLFLLMAAILDGGRGHRLSLLFFWRENIVLSVRFQININGRLPFIAGIGITIFKSL
jgi:hypothetical protein